MPPYRKDSDATARGTGGRTRRVGNAIVTERTLSGSLQHDLDAILQQREALERKLADIDERVYDLESLYLKECVELGGSLFDGYGVERSSFLNTGTTFPFASPVVASPSGRGGAASPSSAGYTNFPGSPSASSGAISAFTAVAANTAGSGTTTEASAMAFRARTQNFTPSERLFSSTSVGAIGRVEQAKAIAAAGGGSGVAQRFTATAGGGRRGAPSSSLTSTAAATGGDGGVWGVNSAGGGGVMTRRRRRGEREADKDEERDAGRRRTRGE